MHHHEFFITDFDLDNINVPTKLYNLQPIGIGSNLSESVTSYISRLADLHNISTRILMRDIIIKNIKTCIPYWNNARALNIYRCQGYVSGSNITKSLITALQEATEVKSLENCTMLPINNIIAGRGLLSSEERHCPYCLIGTNYKEFFGKLYWKVRCAKACHIHNIELVESKCGADPQQYLHSSERKILSGICSTCGSIGYKCIQNKVVTAKDEDIWKSQQIADLIATFPRANEIYSKQTLMQGIKRLIDLNSGGIIADAAKNAGIHKSVLWEWLQGTYNPSLAALLDLCMSCGVSLSSVLRGTPEEVNCPTTTQIKEIKKGPQKPSSEERIDSLNKALIEDRPKSLSSVANTLGINRKMLRIQYPELSSLVVNRYKEFTQKQTKKIKKEANEHIRKLIKELTRQNMSLTHRNFEKATGKTLMPQTLLRQELDLILSRIRPI
jgi:transcriptional regulator with XRE-family HTH domain